MNKKNPMISDFFLRKITNELVKKEGKETRQIEINKYTEVKMFHGSGLEDDLIDIKEGFKICTKCKNKSLPVDVCYSCGNADGLEDVTDPIVSCSYCNSVTRTDEVSECCGEPMEEIKPYGMGL